MTRGRFSVAHGFVMALAALAAAVQADLISFTFTGENASIGSPVSGASSVGETVTVTYTPDSAAAPTAISSTLGLHDVAITSFDVTTSEGYIGSPTEVRIAVSNGDLHDHDRYQAVIGESPALVDLNALDVNGIALGSSTISLFDRTNTSDTSLPARLDISRFHGSDSKTAMQVAFDVGSSSDIEASLVTATSLSPEQEIVSGFEPSSILVFLVGVIGLALTGLALMKRKTTRRRSNYMTVQAGEVRRIRHNCMHLRWRTWLAMFLPVVAYVYLLLFGLPKVVRWLVT